MFRERYRTRPHGLDVPWIPGQVGEIQQHPDQSCFNSECRGQGIHAADLSKKWRRQLAAWRWSLVGCWVRERNFGDLSPFEAGLVPFLYIKKYVKTKKQGFDDFSPKRKTMLKKKHVCFLKWVLFPKSSRCSRCFTPLFDMLALDSLLLKLNSMSEPPHQPTEKSCLQKFTS